MSSPGNRIIFQIKDTQGQLKTGILNTFVCLQLNLFLRHCSLRSISLCYFIAAFIATSLIQSCLTPSIYHGPRITQCSKTSPSTYTPRDTLTQLSSVWVACVCIEA